jgi:hypothetical protein
LILTLNIEDTVAKRSLSKYLEKAKSIIKNEGCGSLLKRAYSYYRPRLFRYEHVYLYLHPVNIELDPALFKPRRDDVECLIIYSHTEADRSAVDHVDLREVVFDARNILSSGGVAVCLYIGRDLAHISWLALNQESRNWVDELPYKIDFSEKRAVTGKSYTDPKFRSQNLMVHGNYQKLKYLKEQGILFLHHAVGVDNIASQKAYSKFSPVIYAEATYLKIFCLKFRKEKPLKEKP